MARYCNSQSRLVLPESSRIGSRMEIKTAIKFRSDNKRRYLMCTLILA